MNGTNGLPFVQMVSTVDPHSAMDEFRAERRAYLAQAPPTVDPEVFVNSALGPSFLALLNATSPTPDASSDEPGAVSGALSSEDDETLWRGSGLSKQWGVAALALLGANLFVGLILLGVTLTMCVRGMKGRSASGPRYTPVRFKEGADTDPEGGPLNLHRYSD